MRCSTSVEHVHGRVVPVDRSGRVDLDAARRDARSRRVRGVGDGRQQRGRHDHRRRRGRRRSSGASHPDAVLHTDAVQAASLARPAHDHPARRPVVAVGATSSAGRRVSACSSSAAARFEPLLIGGGQERERRSGTQNVAGIVAMAEALRLADARARDRAACGSTALRDRLVDGIAGRLDGVMRDGAPRRTRWPARRTSASQGVENEALLFLLDEAGVCASRGVGVRGGRDGAVARARRRWASTATGPSVRCACRSGGPPPTPTSTAPSTRRPGGRRASCVRAGRTGRGRR